MKSAGALLLSCVMSATSFGQVQVSVSTDHLIYAFGDTVQITVIAHNPKPDTLFLWFSSSCQANFRIDDFSFLDYVGCLAVITERIIPPYESAAWKLRYPDRHFGWSFLSVGTHAVSGEVLGHGLTDTLLITVTSATSVIGENAHANELVLGQNYPNPFNGETSIPFSVRGSGQTVITVYNALGERIRTLLNAHLTAGPHRITADFSGLPSGTYWMCLQVDGATQTRKMVHLK